VKAVKERLLREGERGFVVKGAGYFPVLIKLRDGSLAAVLRSGAPHIGVGGRLDFVRSPDGGKTWSSPQTIVYMPPDTRNPAFGQAPDGKLILAFAVTGPYPKGKWQPPISTRYSVWLTLSEDNGQTWLPPRSLKVSPLAYGSPYGKIVSLPDGTLLLPVYQWDEEQRYGSYILRSRDGGWNWDEPTLIAEGHNEAALTVLPDGTLLAVVRRNDNSLSECYSEDGGRTWTPPQKLTEAPYHPADVIVLSSGRVLLTFGRRIEPYGAEAVLGEFENGRVKWLWETRTLIEWRAANPDCGYPSSVQLDDGTIVTLVYGVGLKDDTVEGAFCVWIRYREDALLCS